MRSRSLFHMDKHFPCDILQDFSVNNHFINNIAIEVGFSKSSEEWEFEVKFWEEIGEIETCLKVNRFSFGFFQQHRTCYSTMEMMSC